jgi:hypothetical protein
VLALLMPMLGLGLFSAGNYYLTGDFLGFLRIQSTWGGHMVLPPIELLTRLDPDNGAVFTGAIFTAAALAVMLLFIRKVDFGADAGHHPDIIIILRRSCWHLRYTAVSFRCSS